MKELKYSTSDYAGVGTYTEKGTDNPSLYVIDGYFALPFAQTRETLDNIEVYSRFIKKCENMVRTNEDYKKYIGVLKNEVGLTFCQIMSNISDEMADIEMHHGPIFNLYDICSIVTNYFLDKNGKVTTFQVAEQVLDDHFEHIIQVIMLSETIHQVHHAQNRFLNMKHAFGRLDLFIEKYKPYIKPYQFEIIAKYIELSLNNDSDFVEATELGKELTSYSKYNELYAD